MDDDRRWFIHLTLAPSIRLNNGVWVYPQAVWPLRFKTYQEAFRYAIQCNPNRPLPDGRTVRHIRITTRRPE